MVSNLSVVLGKLGTTKQATHSVPAKPIINFNNRNDWDHFDQAIGELGYGALLARKSLPFRAWVVRDRDLFRTRPRSSHGQSRCAVGSAAHLQQCNFACSGRTNEPTDLHCTVSLKCLLPFLQSFLSALPIVSAIVKKKEASLTNSFLVSVIISHTSPKK